MANELDRVIKIDGNDYNVNAVKADKVANKLTINKVNLGDTESTPSTTKELDYDGSSAKTLDIVPASGGRFRGRIKVPKNTNATIDNEAVLNYDDIKNVILQNVKNNAIVYEWASGTINPIFSETNTINSISIVTGDDDAAEAFAEANNSLYTDAEPCLPTYLYIGTKDNLVYFGTAESKEIYLLNINMASVVEQANKLTTSRTITVNLENTTPASFDGSDDITLGVTGTLPQAKGGTGTTSLMAARVGEAEEADYASLLRDPTDGRITAAASETRVAIDNVAGILATSGSNKITVPRATSATSATNATKDGSGNTITTYYQKKITCSTSAPTSSQGAVGDIWIVYDS